MFKTAMLLFSSAIVLQSMDASAQSATTARCDRLAAFYDRSVIPAPADQGWTPRGRAERILGAEECRKGQVDNGVRLLEQAIRMAGYKVPAA
ncbi:MAG: hypothetical protein Q8N31_19900 [Reyranella sp.]|nr:hypothetical protein [Reyranella sp.]